MSLKGVVEIWGGKNHLWKRVILSLLGTTSRASPSPKRVKPSLEAPNKLKKTSLSNKAPNYKKRKTWSLNLKEFWVKKKKERKKILNPYLSFSSCPSLSSSASYYYSAPCLHSNSPSPLFFFFFFFLFFYLSLSLSFYFLVLFLC
jgi:hypothetical protein